MFSFRYDKRRYKDEAEDDRSMENNKFSSIMMEEARSARIGEERSLCTSTTLPCFFPRSYGGFRRHEKRGRGPEAEEEQEIILVSSSFWSFRTFSHLRTFSYLCHRLHCVRVLRVITGVTLPLSLYMVKQVPLVPNSLCTDLVRPSPVR